MNDFSGQIFEILITQAGIFNFLNNFFFKYHCRQSIMLLSCCVFTAICIDQTNTKCFPFQKKVFYII